MERINIMETEEISNIIDTNICIHKKDNSYGILKRSVQKYGQLRPVILNRNNEIVDGHKLFKIFKELKYFNIWVIKKDIDSKEQLYCELNMNTSELDAISFFKYIKEKIDIDDHCLPFSKSELKDFIKLLDFDWDSFSKKKNQIKKLF